MPDSPPKVSVPGTAGHTQPGDLSQAAGHQCSLGVIPQAKPIQGTGCQGDDILEGAAQLLAPMTSSVT